MKIAVIGTGYVGLVSGICLAESGNDVTCVDVDEAKVHALHEGRLPIYEPGLGELLSNNQREGRVHFTTDLGAALAGRELVFIAVGTPQGEDGSADLGALWQVADQIRQLATDSKVVVVKSTVPVGTNARLLARLNDGAAIRHRTASNPEFLKEGCAIDDFLKPDRVVVGVREAEVAKILRELHAPFLRTDHPFLVMTPESAEMTKYVANAMLATKISFVNEMANLCERLGADINDVRVGIGHDQRIGFQFLFPGVGYGGSCFPKDVRALTAMAERNEVAPRVLRAVDEVNEAQKQVLFAKITELLGTNLGGRTIAVWGLAFKPRTDDVREAPSLVLLQRLLDAGATLRVHDPQAMGNIRQVFGDRLTYCERSYDALENADALAILTEWQGFRHPDFAGMLERLRQPIVIDGRNLYDPQRMRQLGITYASIGRQTVRP